MMRTIQQWLLGSMMVLLIVGLIGCGLFEDNTPTTPRSSSSSDELSNFYVSRGVVESVGVYVGKEFFQVNVPAGDYYLSYVTNFGTFPLVFRADENALLTIGLHSGDVLQEVQLQKGTISASALKSMNAMTFGSGFVTVVVSPTSGGGTVNIAGIFTTDPSTTTLTLVSGGKVIGSTTVTLLPVPVLNPPTEPGPVLPVHNWVCPATSAAGSDLQETHYIQMQQKDLATGNTREITAGSFTFSYETYSIKDQVIVLYEGKELFNSGCVGTQGWKDETITYNGSSSEIVVKIEPNCTGFTTGTLWKFEMPCPTPSAP